MSTSDYSTDIHVLRSAKASVAAQIFFTLFALAGIFVPLKPEDSIINEIALLETVSQLIELAYYLIAIWYFGKIYTWTRYIDWVISTPIMLISTMAFFEHLRDPDTRTTIGGIFDASNLTATVLVLSFNMLMLVFGLLAELKVMLTVPALTLGGVSFVASFFIMFYHYVLHTTGLSLALFLFMYIVWGFYGIAATQSNVARNVAYNGLDVVAKNFYGVFILIYGFTIMI